MRMRRWRLARVRRWQKACVGVAALGCTVGSTALAQTEFPVQVLAPRHLDRAVARGTLQTMSQLPPVSNVGYSMSYDVALGTFTESRKGLTSGMVPSARFSRKGSVSAILSFAYFNLDNFDGEDSTTIVLRPPGAQSPVAGIGVSSRVAADVYAVRMAARYTLLDNLDFGVNIPLVTVRTTSRYRSQALDEDSVAGFLDQGVNTPTDENTLIDVPLNRIDFPGSFNEGTNFDLGNVMLDAKYGFPIQSDELAVGMQMRVRLPTASERHFSGTDTTGLSAQLLASWQGDQLGAYFAGGYEHDFSTDVLSHGSVAASGTFRPSTESILEIGMNASFYVDDLSVYDTDAILAAVPGTELVGGVGELGRNEVNIGGGGRYNLTGDLILSGYVSVPVTKDGYRPDWVMSLSLDYAF